MQELNLKQLEQVSGAGWLTNKVRKAWNSLGTINQTIAVAVVTGGAVVGR